MRKAILASIAMLLAMSVLAGCTGSDLTEPTWEFLENGDSVKTEISGITLFSEKLPAESSYNGKTITLESVDYYQNYVNYQYTLFAVVAIDVTQLSESDIHWLRKSDMDIRAFVTHEKNKYDFDGLSKLGSVLLTDTQRLYVVFNSSFWNEARYDFSGAEITLNIDLTQEETYEYATGTGEKEARNKKNAIMYTGFLPEEITDAEKIPQSIYKYVSKWLQEKAASYS